MGLHLLPVYLVILAFRDQGRGKDDVARWSTSQTHRDSPKSDWVTVTGSPPSTHQNHSDPGSAGLPKGAASLGLPPGRHLRTRARQHRDAAAWRRAHAGLHAGGNAGDHQRRGRGGLIHQQKYTEARTMTGN